ncbi:hypothetical protein SCHPADRAFT_826716 [Schizopora paradoxa]|uniref:Uncharacterized protein n=1 Tax=Schizopora paradoxa TaxID=27342 RepID=A0A0H2RQK2_9AGAM|nr:hypothetical protein SCHPADRAFT_826716 [Schizopora paradoxa]
MPSLNPEASVYTKELFKFKYGTPLYDPDPADSYDVVRIGDVGYITDYGSFIRLFNVCYPADHPINNSRVPDNFVHLGEKYRASHRSVALRPGPVSSMEVEELGGTVSLSGATLPANFEVRLTCKKRQGAALLIYRHAIREVSKHGNAFRGLMLKNYKDWLAFIQDELEVDDIALGDIRLVTGHILTNEWSTGVVVEKSHNCEVRFKVEANTLASASIWGSWNSESSISFPKRFGPTSLPPPFSNVHDTMIQAGRVSDIVGDERMDIDHDSGDSRVLDNERAGDQESPLNQCIFLRAYRIKPRQILPDKISAAAVPKDNSRDFDNEKHGPSQAEINVIMDEGDDFEDSVSVVVVVTFLLHSTQISFSCKGMRYF